MKENIIYNAKILLFGEYSVIFNSNALTIPYAYFTGKWSFMGENKYTRFDKAVKSNRDLYDFYKSMAKNEPLKQSCQPDLERFRRDLNKGLYFESNIPQGYGVGSSGALVAAFYRSYCEHLITGTDNASIQELKEIFSLIEAYFHGTSSGMDPLNCYLGEPLLFEGKDKARTIDVPRQNNNGNSAIFLINSGFPAATEPLVKAFMEKARDDDFRESIYNELIPLTNKSIERIINGRLDDFFTGLKDLSEYQYIHFDEMIPGKFKNLWKQGIDTGEFHLKLCGSGGGGFLLGFTRDYSVAERLVADAGIDIIPVYKSSIFRK